MHVQDDFWRFIKFIWFLLSVEVFGVSRFPLFKRHSSSPSESYSLVTLEESQDKKIPKNIIDIHTHTHTIIYIYR